MQKSGFLIFFKDYQMLYIIGGILTVPLAIYFYCRAVASRKLYQCAKCGDRFKVELEDLECCITCGAPLDHSSVSRLQ